MTVQSVRTPWLVAARAQFRLLWWSRRAMMLLMILIGTFVMLEIVMRVFGAAERSGSGPATIAVVPLMMQQLLGIILLVAFGWGIAVWRGETAEQRTQMLTAPIDVSHHELARAGAGAAWLLVGVFGFLIVGMIMTVLRGETSALAAVEPGVWLLFLTGPLLAYCLIISVSTATPRAFEYVVFGFLGFTSILTVLELRGHREFIENVIQPVFTGRFGVGAALSAEADVPLSFGGWLAALVLWYGISALALLGVLRWRRGRAA